MFLAAFFLGLVVFTVGTQGTEHDQNGCPIVDGNKQHMKVFGKFCYNFDTYSLLGFLEAEKKCQKDGGSLVHIKSKAENDFIGNEMKSNKWKGQFWIGLNDEDKDGDYTWTDGSDFDNQSYSNLLGPKQHVVPGLCAVFDGRVNSWLYRYCHWTFFVLGETPTKFFICQYQKKQV